MFSSAFVYLLAELCKKKLLNQFSQNSVKRWQMNHGKKRLDFGGGLRFGSEYDRFRVAIRSHCNILWDYGYMAV